MQSIINPENLNCEKVSFEFKKPGSDTEIREAEFAYVTDLDRFIQLQLTSKNLNVKMKIFTSRMKAII